MRSRSAWGLRSISRISSAPWSRRSGKVSRTSTPVSASTRSCRLSRCWTLTVVQTSMPCDEQVLDVLVALAPRRPLGVRVGELVDACDRRDAARRATRCPARSRPGRPPSTRCAAPSRCPVRDPRCVRGRGARGTRSRGRRPPRRRAVRRRASGTSCPRPRPRRGRCAAARARVERRSRAESRGRARARLTRVFTRPLEAGRPRSRRSKARARSSEAWTSSTSDSSSSCSRSSG